MKGGKSRRAHRRQQLHHATTDFRLLCSPVAYLEQQLAQDAGADNDSSSYDDCTVLNESCDFSLAARNPHQESYLTGLQSAAFPICVAYGEAGSGKTFMSVAYAAQSLIRGDYQKIVLTRPMVSVEDKHFGALPGDIQAKMLPWLLPLYDVLHKYFSHWKLQSLIKRGCIEICPLMHMRGRSFENTIIVADEMQNSTPAQMLMLLTRIGQGSKIAVTGDPRQQDLHVSALNGLSDFLQRVRAASPSNTGGESKFHVTEFTGEDVLRHPVVKDVLSLYR